MTDLNRSYRHRRALHRAHGRTYSLATMLLPAWKRRHVSALYGFTRYTDMDGRYEVLRTGSAVLPLRVVVAAPRRSGRVLRFPGRGRPAAGRSEARVGPPGPGP